MSAKLELIKNFGLFCLKKAIQQAYGRSVVYLGTITDSWDYIQGGTWGLDATNEHEIAAVLPNQ
jgi:hypothetical protein